MCIFCPGSSRSCCLWLDANVVITQACGMNAPLSEMKTGLLCVRLLFSSCTLLMGLMILAPPPSPPRLTLHPWGGDPLSSWLQSDRMLSRPIIRPHLTPLSVFPLSHSISVSFIVFLSMCFLGVSRPQHTHTAAPHDVTSPPEWLYNELCMEETDS